MEESLMGDGRNFSKTVTDTLAAPLNLPPPLRAAEAAYNSGRAAHQLGLPHLAVSLYEEALRCGGEVEAYVEEHAELFSSGERSALKVWGALDIRREAAFNLVLLYKDGGCVEKALLLTKKYLSFE